MTWKHNPFTSRYLKYSILYYTLFASVQKYYKSAAVTLPISLGEYNELWTVMKFLTKVDHLNNRIPHSIKAFFIRIKLLVSSILILYFDDRII